MARRFTDTEKWNIPWFRRLPAEFKLAWGYLLDNCDHAGVIRLDDELANFQIGVNVDWPAFIEACGDRLSMLDCGKLWIVDFIEFQYGELSENCNAHKPALASVKKHGLLKGRRRVRNPSGTLLYMDKDKDKDTKGGVGENETGDDWILPDGWECPELRTALDDWLAMRRRIKRPVKSKSSTSKIFKQFDSVTHLIAVCEFCEANEYQGLKPEYCKPQSRPMTAQSQRESNMAAVHRKLASEEQQSTLRITAK